MFQNLRINSQVYILHKDGNPYVECGTVMRVIGPKSKYPMTTPGVGQFPQMEMVVDLVLDIGGQQVTLEALKANADIDDSSKTGNVVVSCSREAINNEIAMMRQKSVDILNSTEYHKNVIASCDKMLNTLNPEIAAKQEQEQRIQNLESQLNNLAGMMQQLVAMSRGGNVHSDKSESSETSKTRKS